MLKRNNFVNHFFIIMSLCFFGCIKNNETQITRGTPQVQSVSVVNNQLVVNGAGLSRVTAIQLKNNSTNEMFTVESAAASQVIANGIHDLSIATGAIFELILSSAQGASSYQVTFSLSNGSVTSAILADGAVMGGKINSMGATTGQVLKYNGTTWGPSTLVGGQTYLGGWNATTNTPNPSASSPQSGEYYITTVAGTQDLGGGSTSYQIGDWIMYNGTGWDKISNSSNVVTSFQGRQGVVVPTSGDYTWSMITKMGSKVEDIADVDITGRANDSILKWDSTSSKWIIGTDSTGGTPGGSAAGGDLAGTYPNPTIGSGVILDSHVGASANIAQSKINGLTAALAAKESATTAGTSAQYYRGDKTWQTLNSDVVTEGATNLYLTNTRVLGVPLTGFSSSNSAIVSTDTIVQAFGKAQGQIDNLGSSSSNFLMKNSVDTITGQVSVNAVTGQLTVPTPVNFNDAANKTYVDSKATQWTTAGSDVYYATGNVGIGTNSPPTKLTVVGGISSPSATGGGAQNEIFGAGAYVGGTAPSNTVIGYGAYVNGPDSWKDYNVVIGASSYSTHRGSTIIGGNSNSSGGFAVVIGAGQSNSAGSAVLIGTSNSMTNGTAAIGNSNGVGHTDATAIGWGLSSERAYETIFGARNYAAIAPSIRLSGSTGQYVGQNLSRYYTSWIDSTDATRKARASLSVYDTAEREFIRADATGTSANVYFPTGSVGVGMTTTPGFALDVNGSIGAVGALQSHSDKRLKKNIIIINNPIDKLLTLSGVYFDWRKDDFPDIHFQGGRQMGVIAQDVEKVFPEAVSKNKEGIRSVAYTMLIAPIIEAVKEFYAKWYDDSAVIHGEIASMRHATAKLEAENAAKDKEIAKLKKDNSAIKARMDKIEKTINSK